MYNIIMAVVSRKKPVTIYLQEIKYLMFQKMAKEQNRKAAELVRDAMDEYIQTHSASKKTFDSWKPLSLGGLNNGAQDWLSKDYQDEMLGNGWATEGVVLLFAQESCIRKLVKNNLISKDFNFGATGFSFKDFLSTFYKLFY